MKNDNTRKPQVMVD